MKQLKDLLHKLLACIAIAACYFWHEVKTNWLILLVLGLLVAYCYYIPWS